VSKLGRLIVRPGLSALQKSAPEAAQRPFYSAVDKAIEEIVSKQPKGTGDQYLGMIMKAKGVKPAEVKDRGLDKALKGRGKMTGQDLIKTSEDMPAPQLEEKTLGMNLPKEALDDLESEVNKEINYKIQRMVDDGESESLIESTREYYSQGQGREELRQQVLREQPERFEYQYEAAYSGYKTPGGENYREILFKVPGKQAYKSKHFGEHGENVMAHARVQDMTGPNGERILLIDEIQSDIHQQGRKKGYSSPEEKQYLVDKLARGEELTAEEEALRLKYLKGDMPADVPFKKNWHELVVKRLMDDAVKGGYDKVIIAPGEAQLSRYPLSKHIDDLIVGESYKGLRQISFRPKNDLAETALKFDENGIIKNSMIPELNGKDVYEVFGKDLGQKIVESKPYERFEGVDLDIGGQGMKGFYDQILPSYIKKEYGVDIGQYPVRAHEYGVVRGNRGGFTVVPEGGNMAVGPVYDTLEEAQAVANQMSKVPYHSIDITPEIRERITTQGQPLYQIAPVAGAVGAGMMASDEEPTEYKRGGKVRKPVSLDAMRLAVLSK